MKIGQVNRTSSVKDYNIATLLRDIIDIVDGRLTFEDNIQGKIIRNVYFHAANFNIPVVHDLNRTINDFIIVGSDQFALFKRGTQEPTNNRLYIQSDTANTYADVLILG